jgi:hypothetical protein
MLLAEIEPTAAPPQLGMARRHPPLTAATASTVAASQRLFGDLQSTISVASHRGDYLRFVLRSLYGADYRRRGAMLLGVNRSDLSRMMSGGLRVSRRIVDRLENALAGRLRTRRKELRALAAAIEGAFAAEERALAACPALVATLARMASAAANTHNPHSSETGRFVPRVQRKAPVLREPGCGGKQGMALG